MPKANNRIPGLKRVVAAELKALGELAEAGIRTSDFPRYDAQQQRVADAKADLRKAMGIVDPMPESEYCAHCRRSVDRDTEALERFNDGTILHVHCADGLRDEGQLPALWYSHSNGLDTFNQVAVTNGDQTIVLADLARFEKCIHRIGLWNAAFAFADAYAAALNSEIEEN